MKNFYPILPDCRNKVISMKVKKIFALFIFLCTLDVNIYAQLETPEKITNSIGVDLVLLPAGSFVMGSPYEEKWHQNDELVQNVTLSNSFYMSAAEITQAQWESIMGFNRSDNKGNDLPVEKISWKDAVSFCEKLSAKEGKTYRLPTEAEWEYACRAGSDLSIGSVGDLQSSAWYSENSDNVTHPVKQKQANAWGLYDMLGNVSEWCADIYEKKYPETVSIDPTGPETGPLRVIRGGAFDTFPPGLRCAARTSAPASYQFTQTGLRIVLEL